jgi:hypothetical protein
MNQNEKDERRREMHKDIHEALRPFCEKYKIPAEVVMLYTNGYNHVSFSLNFSDIKDSEKS